MKRFAITVAIFTSCLVLMPTQRSHGQAIALIIREAVVKVIKAVDLMIQRLQNATIQLQNAQKAIENELSKLKLKEIADWGEKQRQLFQTYYDELWHVRSIIMYYQRVKDIVAKQAQIVSEYKAAYSLFQQDKHFSAKELSHMSDVYLDILNQSVKNVEELTMVINSLTTEMSDAARLTMIGHVGQAVDNNLADLRSFTHQNKLLSLQRSKDASDMETVRQLYGLP
jgi:hypothetical protein